MLLFNDIQYARSDLPLFSIVTINYNNVCGLKATVESVQDQSNSNYEFIVIDGGSNDGSYEYLQEKRHLLSVLVSENDNGIYHAMNKGCAYAHGEFIVFMNSGDRFTNADVLALVAEELAATKAWPDFIYGDSFEEREDGQGLLFKKAKSHTMSWYGMFTQHQSMFFSRKRMANFGIRFDEQYSLAADWDFVIRFLRTDDDECNLLRVQSPLSVFARRGVSSNYKKAIVEQFSIRREKMKWGLISCCLLGSLHLILNQLRILFPGVYCCFNRIRSVGYHYLGNRARE
jgi:putative colanic acid biosynthesis glycosyltransferase